jgi:hypothetical protein
MQSEAEQVINMPNTSEPAGIRDRAILETLYFTGIRRIELITSCAMTQDSRRPAEADNGSEGDPKEESFQGRIVAEDDVCLRQPQSPHRRTMARRFQ